MHLTSSKPGKRNLVLVSGRAHMSLAKQVAEELKIHLTPTTAYNFASGEIYVRCEESVRGADVFIMQSHTFPVNKWLMEQLLMIDSLKRASARSITALLPFYPYARQDKKHKGREPISARLIADLYKTAGANRLVSVDLHTAQIQGFFDGPVDHLWAMPLLADYVRTKIDLNNCTVVSPDTGRVRMSEQWSERLGGTSLAFVHKTRDLNRPNEVKTNRIVGEVEGKTCILIDDMIDTGGTMAGAVKALLKVGAKEVFIVATHGVLSYPAAERLSDSGAKEVIITDTLPITDDKKFKQLTILSVAPVIARAISEVYQEGSVTSLFGGNT